MDKVYINKNNKDIIPERVVILGANGFIGSECAKRLKRLNIKCLLLNRNNIDLTTSDAANKLAKLLKPNDTLLFISADAPVKNEEMFLNNIKICKSVSEAVRNQVVNHLIYISSDAVYSDSMGLIDEKTNTQPYSLHGIMHLTRELMLNSFAKKYLCVLRPTLIYGSSDPHNGYGPNSFMRKVINKEDVALFGNGEERRDHIFIGDVANAIIQVILKKGIGKLNIVTGEVTSFYEIAKLTIKLSKSNSSIINADRIGPMPHNGYRAFDPSLLKNSFPHVELTNIQDGLREFLEKA